MTRQAEEEAHFGSIWTCPGCKTMRACFYLALVATAVFMGYLAYLMGVK